MSNNKQSSLEWLQWALEHTILSHEQVMQSIGLFEQAKAMHKEEMIEFCYSWSHEQADRIDIEEDYNETYGDAH
jgi:hypothetical protein